MSDEAIEGRRIRSALPVGSDLVEADPPVTTALQSSASSNADSREKDAILNAIQIGVYGVDDRGRCTFINQAGLDLIGYERDEVIGRNMHDLIHHTYPDGSPYPQTSCPLLNTLRSGHTVRLDNETLWRKDGTFFTAEYSSFPVLDQGVVTGSVVTFQDTTQRAQAQKRLALQITVSRILAGGADMGATMSLVLEAICSGLGWQVGVFWTFQQQEAALRAATIWASPSLQADEFLAQTAQRSVKPGLGLTGRVWEADAPAHIDDLAADSSFQRREAAIVAGLRFAFAFPVKAGAQTLGVAEFFSRDQRHVDDGFLDSIATLGQQIGQYQRRKWAEEALRDSEARFRTLANAIPQLAWTTDGDGEIKWYNQRWYDYTGTTFESMQGWGWRAVQHPDHVERVVDHFKQTLAAGEPWQDTFPLRRKDGSYRWFLSRAVPLRDDGGRIWGWFGTNTDVTEEREAEERALAAERRLTLALESARIGAWSWDSTTDLVEADSRVRDIFGLAEEGAIPVTDFFSRIHPEDAPRVTGLLETARQSSGAYDIDFRIVLPSGEVRWVVSRGLVGGRPGGDRGMTMSGITWEVTDQKVAEAALRHSEERFRSLIEATAAIVWTTKASGEFGDDQPSWTAFTGQDAEAMRGWGWLDAIHPEDRDETAEAWRQAIEGRSVYKIEHRLCRHGVEYRHMLVRAVPILGESGAIREWIGVHTDITTRKRAEEELAAAKEAAEEANRAKSQFIANMSHELRTPLSAVIGYSEMLEEEVEELGHPSIREDLRKIENNARHLLSLINDVLDLSKIEAGKMEVHPEDFDAASLVTEVAETVEGLITKKDNELVVQCAPDLGQMHSDPVKVRQCLFNLLSNAAKFTEGGRITLSADRVDLDGRDELVVRVTDTGIGMSAEEMEKLFTRFTQADSSTTRRFGGTGLGLSITKAFCTMLGGDISVESQPDRGTTFTIRLPADMRLVPVEDAGADAPESSGQDHASLVLVIDDDPSTRELLSRFLKREGFSVRTASDGAAGLRCARDLAPCAILLDVMMPRMDGWAVLSALKADPELAEIPVIMVTMVQEKGLGFSLGAADYLTKPVQWPRLKKVLDRYRCEIQPGHALLVENDPPLRGELRGLLEQEGWAVVEVESGEAALAEIAKARPELILTDLQTSDSSGFAFIQQLRRHADWRSIPVIAVTDAQLTPAERERLQGQVRQVIQADDEAKDELLAELRRIASNRVNRVVAVSNIENNHG